MGYASLRRYFLTKSHPYKYPRESSVPRSYLLTYCSEGTFTVCIASGDLLLILVRAILIAPGGGGCSFVSGSEEGGELLPKEQECVETKSNFVRKEEKKRTKKRRKGGLPFYRDCDHPPTFCFLRSPPRVLSHNQTITDSPLAPYSRNTTT